MYYGADFVQSDVATTDGSVPFNDIGNYTIYYEAEVADADALDNILYCTYDISIPCFGAGQCPYGSVCNDVLPGEPACVEVCDATDVAITNQDTS